MTLRSTIEEQTESLLLFDVFILFSGVIKGNDDPEEIDGEKEGCGDKGEKRWFSLFSCHRFHASPVYFIFRKAKKKARRQYPNK